MKVSSYNMLCVFVCLSVAASCQRTLKSGLESSDWRPQREQMETESVHGWLQLKG